MSVTTLDRIETYYRNPKACGADAFVQRIKEAPKIKFSLFEKGYIINPNKWIVKDQCVFRFSEKETIHEMERFKLVYGYLPINTRTDLHAYMIFTFSFVDKIKYYFWRVSRKRYEEKQERMMAKAQCQERQAELLQQLADEMTKDIEKAMIEVQEDITKAKELIERMEF